jgi:exopolysaccharide biosynthesis polyprenyl glycosylphosphotransferase
LFAHHRKRVHLLFASADGILTALAFELAYLTRTRLALEHLFYLNLGHHVLLILGSVAFLIAVGSFLRVYEHLHSADLRHLLATTLRQCLYGTVLVIIFQYLLQLEHPLSRSFLLLFFLIDCFLLTSFRWASPHLIGTFAREFGTPYHIVIVGSSNKASALAENLRENSPFPIQISARLSEEECTARMPELLARQIVDEVIFNVDSSKLPGLEEVFLRCDEEGVRTRVAIDFFPHVNSEITLDRVGSAPLLTFSAAPLDDLRLLLKRFFDIVISGTALVLLAPVFLAIALLIRLTSPGPIIFRQLRCGLNGRRFTMYKFRSMVDNAEDLMSDLQHLSTRQVAFKIARDPRVTPVGLWLRRFSLDELPQLLNVLRGDMSIVGPRPPIPEEVDRYERWQRRRLRMRPGLTCLWAISGRDRVDFNTWMRMDISYIENWSLRLDWTIILRTIPLVLAGRGAH